MTTILTVLAFAALFVLWGAMRPMDRGGGCHTCPHADPTSCGSSCALFEALETEPDAGVER